MTVHVYLLIHRKEEGGFEEKTKELFPCEKQLQIAEGDGVQSFLAIFSENIDEGRKTLYNFDPQAAMFFDSLEGIVFVKKWHEVMNLYQSMNGLIMFYISVLYI
jgi:hypothetical protein